MNEQEQDSCKDRIISFYAKKMANLYHQIEKTSKQMSDIYLMDQTAITKEYFKLFKGMKDDRRYPSVSKLVTPQLIEANEEAKLIEEVYSPENIDTNVDGQYRTALEILYLIKIKGFTIHKSITTRSFGRELAKRYEKKPKSEKSNASNEYLVPQLTKKVKTNGN